MKQDTGTLPASLAASVAVVEALVNAGVAYAIISPGARSVPLAWALARHPDLHCPVIVDERSAGFYALGIARLTGKPVALCCTSGSALANWFPAVMEASQQGIPLILLSADLPTELLGWGAPQMVEQHRLFGSFVRACHALLPPAEGIKLDYYYYQTTKAISEATGFWPGPVHVNFPLRDPLAPGNEQDYAYPAFPALRVYKPELHLPEAAIEQTRQAISGKQGLMVCGGGLSHSALMPIVALARKLQWPVVADPLSQLRFGMQDRDVILSSYDTWIRDKATQPAAVPEVILRFGNPLISKAMEQYLATSRAFVINVSEQGPWLDPDWQSRLILQGKPEQLCHSLLEAPALVPAPATWLMDFVQREQHTQAYLAGRMATDTLYEGSVLKVVLEHAPDNALLFTGNSSSIRAVDTFACGQARKLHIVANRGVNGIDGNVSTCIGMAAVVAAQDDQAANSFGHAVSQVIGLFGDLTFHHDINALALARNLNVTLIVSNNNGAGIFEHFPNTKFSCYEEILAIRPEFDFAELSTGTGCRYFRCTTPAEFEAAFLTAINSRGPKVIEACFSATESADKIRQCWQLED